jgi:hypothetical protein
VKLTEWRNLKCKSSRHTLRYLSRWRPIRKDKEVLELIDLLLNNILIPSLVTAAIPRNNLPHLLTLTKHVMSSTSTARCGPLHHCGRSCARFSKAATSDSQKMPTPKLEAALNRGVKFEGATYTSASTSAVTNA